MGPGTAAVVAENVRFVSKPCVVCAVSEKVPGVFWKPLNAATPVPRMVKVWWTRSGMTVCVVRENDAVVTPLLASHIQPALPLAQVKLDPV